MTDPAKWGRIEHLTAGVQMWMMGVQRRHRPRHMAEKPFDAWPETWRNGYASEGFYEPKHREALV